MREPQIAALDAKRLAKCWRCLGAPLLGRRKDALGWRAIYWCPMCEGPAFGGASFAHVHPNQVESLVVIDDSSKQGSLF